MAKTRKKKKKTRNDFDSPWKKVIYLYLEDFLELCFPEIHSQVDWSLGYEVLDKELIGLARGAAHGTRHADALVRVTRKTGQKALVVLHVEVQSQPDELFPERMFVYHYRAFDKHGQDVVSVAVLGDTQHSWRPTQYEWQLWGCRKLLTFPTVKLIDLEARAAQQPKNPVAWLILAHMQAQRTPPNSVLRLHSKVRLLRGLYGCGLSRQQIIDFFKLVDWVLALSPDLEYDFKAEMALVEKETGMRYITSIERLATKEGREKGLEQGREQGLAEGLLQGLAHILRQRFPVDSGPLLERLQQRSDAAEINQVIALALTADDYSTLDSLVDQSVPKA